MEASGFKKIFDSRGAFFRDSTCLTLSTMHGGPSHKNIMITLVLSNTTRIRIELLDMDPVRATSVLCLLGFGLGLGSLLVYKLYSRYINQSQRRRQGSPASADSTESDQPSGGESLANIDEEQSRDSLSAAGAEGSVAMGNSLSDDASFASAYYYGDGVRFRGFHDDDFNRSPQRSSRREAENPLNSSEVSNSFEVIDSPSSSSFVNLPDVVVNTGRPTSLVSQDGSEIPHTPLGGAISPGGLSDPCGSYSDLSVRPNYSPDSLNERNFNLLQGDCDTCDTDMPSYSAGPEVSSPSSDIRRPPSASSSKDSTSQSDRLSDSVVRSRAEAPDRPNRILDSLSKESTPERTVSPQIRRLRERWSLSSDDSLNLDGFSRGKHYYSMSSDYESSPEHRNFSRRASSALSKLGSSSITSDLEYSSGMDTPESEIFDMGDLKPAVDYDKILEEVRDLHTELDEMSSRLVDLCSPEDEVEEAVSDDPDNLLPSGERRRSLRRNSREMKKVYRILHKHKTKRWAALPRSMSLQDDRDFTPERLNLLKKRMSLADHRHSYGGNLNAVSPMEDSISEDDGNSFTTQDTKLDASKLASSLVDPDELSSRLRECMSRIRADLGESFDCGAVASELEAQFHLPNSTSADSFYSMYSCDDSSSHAQTMSSETTKSLQSSLSDIQGSLEQDIANDNFCLSPTTDGSKPSVFPHRFKQNASSSASSREGTRASSLDTEDSTHRDSLTIHRDEVDCDTSMLHDHLTNMLPQSPNTRNFKNIDLIDHSNGNVETCDSAISEDSGLDSRTSFTPESPLTNVNSSGVTAVHAVSVDVQVEDSGHRNLTTTDGSNQWAVKIEENSSRSSADSTSVHSSLGPVEDICTYAEREWKGNTSKAQTIKKGYHAIPQVFSCSHMRTVRGDNYCALRAAIYQTFVHNLRAASQPHFPHLQDAIQSLEAIQSSEFAFLHQWIFARRLPFSVENVLDTAADCLKCFYGQRELVSRLPDLASRAKLVSQVWNSKPVVDVKIMEAVKLLMMMTAIDYYQKNTRGEEVPMFVWLMFARDTSQTPAQLLTHHINAVGDSGGLEQIEMFLLSYTLGVCMEVARPSQHGHDDFVTRYPSDEESFPRICLIAEDDRHYNVAVP